jgi:hypothetical protein
MRIKSPVHDKGSISLLPRVPQTPKNSTPIRPAAEEMHPGHHHNTTFKPLLPEAGVDHGKVGHFTEPIKGNKKLFGSEDTPCKVKSTQKPGISSPDFVFTFKRQSLELSPEARKMMAESREEAAKIRAQMAVRHEECMVPPLKIDRKIAQPKGKCGRFSDIHMAQFKKMDSIANHPSAFRTDPSKLTPKHKSLKRTQSNAGLDESDNNPFLTGPSTDSDVKHADNDGPQLKRTKHKQEDSSSPARSSNTRGNMGSRLPSTPMSARFNRLRAGISPVRRQPHTPTGKINNISSRSQSVKTWRSVLSPPLQRSASIKSLSSALPVKGAVSDAASKRSQLAAKLPLVKSILRTPHRLYSNDPTKVAAGTHIPLPSGHFNLDKELPPLPSTAPVKKHVYFTASTAGEPQVV